MGPKIENQPVRLSGHDQAFPSLDSLDKLLETPGGHIIFEHGGGGGGKGKRKKVQVAEPPADTTLFSSSVMTDLLPPHLRPIEPKIQSKYPTPEKAANEAEKPKPRSEDAVEPDETDWFKDRETPAGIVPPKKGGRKRKTFGGQVHL